MKPRDVVVNGGTGYIGGALTAALVARGHRVRVLARPQSARRVPVGAVAVQGDALAMESVRAALRPGDVLVHLVGTAHPSPSNREEFRRIDLASVAAAIEASRIANVSHFLYVSVAQPAPVMKAYVEARVQGEALLRASGLPATVVRPWYVLGPGHRWPVVFIPRYALAKWFPWTREGAQRLGLVSLQQMVAALVVAIEDPPSAGTLRIVDVPAIRRVGVT